jgi:hypothetical protein
LALKLVNTQVTDAGLKGLKVLTSLRTLDVGGTKVTDAGLMELKELKGLQSLSLAGTEITDAGLKELEGVQSLHTLDLSYTQVTDGGLKELKVLQNLQELDLNNTRVGNGGVKELKGLQGLRTLVLSFTQVTDSCLHELKGLKTLQELNLGYTKVTDAGLKELTGFSGLQRLDLDRTQVTDAGIAVLQTKRPELFIYYDRPAQGPSRSRWYGLLRRLALVFARGRTKRGRMYLETARLWVENMTKIGEILASAKDDASADVALPELEKAIARQSELITKFASYEMSDEDHMKLAQEQYEEYFAACSDMSMSIAAALANAAFAQSHAPGRARDIEAAMKRIDLGLTNERS